MKTPYGVRLLAAAFPLNELTKAAAMPEGKCAPFQHFQLGFVSFVSFVVEKALKCGRNVAFHPLNPNFSPLFR